MRLLFFMSLFFFVSCRTSYKIHLPPRPVSAVSGTGFYKLAAAFSWQQRDSMVLQQVLSGNVPAFFQNFVAVPVSITDSVSDKVIHATYYVSPDYLSIGNDADWARVCITPMAAQKIADSFTCFLPTPKMVDAIYNAATVKLEPIPMYAFRDSTPTMYQHHLIIEGQRKGRGGLIAGIKKDVVVSTKSSVARADRVAIYGWHRLDGLPIQPLYTGHIKWYVDYSHGIRLVYRKLLIEGKWMDFTRAIQHPVYKKLFCDEALCNYYPYSF